ncbi:N-acetylglutamate synthase, GNAT family [Cyclobacterium lianum]|uniref:N-acetylglutamate synthase, GNAT family n=1 Tax=Cyclobacterium lianum TaxID=388280 RepID=A0A1M7Q8J2_9BACT|nr:GNAT family N-acetyltransferase [Cyclobacterium lianum]SHN26865.1 N-acetylglutamate synthase, GNAT family [Cyclobacterium lianum]
MVQITPAHRSHLPQIQEMAKVIWPLTFGAILSQKQLAYMLEMMYSLPSLQQQMEEKGHRFLIAQKDRKAVGFCSYELHYMGSPDLKIHKLYLLPEAQGKGTGREILTYLEKTARKNGMESMLLNVNKFNHNAYGFYISQGFNQIAAEVIPIGNGFVMDDFILEKKI